MKTTIAAIFLIAVNYPLFSQVTNSFPDDGNVGIGTVVPSAELEVKSVLGNDAEIHINAGTDGDHSIIRFQDAGSSTWGFLSNYPVTGKFSLYNYQNNSISLTVNEIGYFGIGKSNPEAKFDVLGVIASSHPNGNNLAMFSSGDGNSYLNYTGGSGISRLGFQFDGASKMSIYKNGSVVIGSGTAGSHKLAVDGSIGAREIKVEVGTWSDYVFEEGYILPTLEEVEKHIKEKGHLINIPSAVEVETNGLELGEMNKLLLEKIEELTLYIIDLKKGQTILEKQNKDLFNQLKNLNQE